MTVLLWLLIPLAGVLVAAVWVWWRSRPKRTPDAVEGMAQMYRIRQAMSQPMPELVHPRPQATVETVAPEQPTIDQSAGVDSTDASFRKSA